MKYQSVKCWLGESISWAWRDNGPSRPQRNRVATYLEGVQFQQPTRMTRRQIGQVVPPRLVVFRRRVTSTLPLCQACNLISEARLKFVFACTLAIGPISGLGQAAYYDRILRALAPSHRVTRRSTGRPLRLTASRIERY